MGMILTKLINALNTKFNNSKPLIIVANTVKGKGVFYGKIITLA